MATKKKATRRRRKNSFTLPAAVLVGLFPLVNQMKIGWEHEGIMGAGKEATYSLTGYHIDSSTFSPSYMWHGSFPMLIGLAVHNLATRFGINRALGRSGIPIVRV